MNPVEYGLGVRLSSTIGLLDGLVEEGVLSGSMCGYMKGVLGQYVGRWIKSNRNGGHCEECGKQFEKTDLQRHHIIPKSEGGDDMPWNLLLLCGECHKKKHGFGGV